MEFYYSDGSLRRNRRRISKSELENKQLLLDNFLALQLVDGKLNVIVGDAKLGTREDKIDTDYDLADGSWHTVDVFVETEVSELIIIS